MNSLQKIMYLSEAQKDELFTNGTITVGGVTYTYSDNVLYCTPTDELDAKMNKARKIYDVTLTEDTPATTYIIETDMGGNAFVLSEADVYCFSPVNTGASDTYTGYINIKSAYVNNYNNNYGALTWASPSQAAINRIHITTDDDLPTLATFSQGNWAATAKTVNVVDSWGATLTTHKQIEGFRIALNQGNLLAGTRIVVFGIDK